MRMSVQAPPEGVHRLPATAASLAEARRIAYEATAGLMTAEQYGKLEIAVTETVSNAVRHAGVSEEIVLTLTPKDGYLCVRVTDAGDGLVPRPGAISSEPGAGFGLFLVEQLTRRWGMTREDNRTRVWFEIDFDAS
jgi:anti-sigma regulatory factor (Ser/Thr protein kinase)